MFYVLIISLFRNNSSLRKLCTDYGLSTRECVCVMQCGSGVDGWMSGQAKISKTWGEREMNSSKRGVRDGEERGKSVSRDK